MPHPVLKTLSRHRDSQKQTNICHTIPFLGGCGIYYGKKSIAYASLGLSLVRKWMIPAEKYPKQA